jgi:hypothetical protein
MQTPIRKVILEIQLDHCDRPRYSRVLLKIITIPKTFESVITYSNRFQSQVEGEGEISGASS